MGGLVETDESIPNYEDIIGSFYMGNNWIKNEFGVNPKVGMNIRSNSHSEINAALFHDMGFEAQFFGTKGIQKSAWDTRR